MSPGETLIAIFMSFFLFFVGYLVRGWSIDDPFKNVSLVVPTHSSYNCKIDNTSSFTTGIFNKE